MAGLANKSFKRCLIRASQRASPALGAAEVGLLELEEMDSSLRLRLGLDQLVDDGHLRGLDRLCHQLGLTFSVHGLSVLWSMLLAWTAFAKVANGPTSMRLPLVSSVT